ncbi:tRNA uridine-5-carboxymethylaminomethyl(34) synthesis GTPase MnmE [Roseomonas sp. OT10]|uniref:tRNA uridine-5-carboxymethylaminomethyl(34) synthesis GTPase MnmE n=1 Tax=Roseomonas cutis TaxID=2897332 RepID=UPI001E4AB131|nr:tRNA uridine-5-carboxymethylaminomethyl(34) synthesis GTPase MnmE [Roseomonas sp. OT10]UFN49724.1 tRNA uridine-5-carboxymethylaminomethyl(34) synthesis GTPase MnmE [Roseomonas sp. OT10]
MTETAATPVATADTIFALASGAGRAAVAVLRLSGPGAGPALDALAGGRGEPRRALLRRLRAPDGTVLDRALTLWFPGPASYTGEDSAELHLHGGRAVVAAVSAALVVLGLRPAEPGEFTRRAFLHGKLDLTAAEGIADLIGAESEAQRRQALRQAEGALARPVRDWSARLAWLLAQQEAAIEFAEEGLPSDLEERVREGAAGLAAEIAAQLSDGGAAERLREGLEVAILGAPNVGKSSLLNALLGREAAIVSARPGTTRDVVEARIELDGLPVTLADTAGLREAAEEIEAEGIRRARHRGEAADIVLAVFAADAPPDAETLALLERREAVVVANRCDLAAPPAAYAGQAALAVSARTGEGLAALRGRLAAEAARQAGGAGLLTRPRHRAALAECLRALAEVPPAPVPELASEALRLALRALGRLTGEVGVEQVLDLVFGEFCIGK